MEKILTVVIPVYNTEKYLLRCFNSITHPSIEVVIVDDGSTDNSSLIIDEYCSNHDNFKAIHIPNRGAATARLVGLAKVRTKYFSFVDSDDVVNISPYLKLCMAMDDYNYKIGNGRMTVYLPNLSIPFNSRKWQKDELFFDKDKREFSNITCSLLDKIWHYDCIDLFNEKSNQKVYEDMEFVYYILAKEGRMLHSNDLIYNYCMRGLSNNSTSSLGLRPTSSDGLQGLLSAATSMREKFIRDDIYKDYEDELNSIIIKLVYQRMNAILKSKEIVNKREMVSLVLQILDVYIPDWRTNKYYLEKFKGSEYNDYIFYITTEFILNIFNIGSIDTKDSYTDLLKSYNKKIKLKKTK